MNRKRARKPTHTTQNLESFLDILTNTVGVLMFISLFITLISVQASSLIRTPLVSKTYKKPYFFEIRGNRVTYINDDAIERQIALLVASLPECDRPKIPENIDIALYQYYVDKIEEYETCRKQMLAKLKSFKGQTDNYTVTFVDLNAVMYEPRSSNVGESIKELAQKNSEFSQVLSKLNSQTDYLAFIVRPDSFPAFRAARKQAWTAGFDVGWEPQTSDIPLVFGSGGRTVGVQ
jgi:hypothetical protein